MTSSPRGGTALSVLPQALEPWHFPRAVERPEIGRLAVTVLVELPSTVSVAELETSLAELGTSIVAPVYVLTRLTPCALLPTPQCQLTTVCGTMNVH
jgi:hypothetical protein